MELNNKIDYRPDIDGLRAISIICVVIFHLNKDWLPSGYLGVDLFFIIVFVVKNNADIYSCLCNLQLFVRTLNPPFAQIVFISKKVGDSFTKSNWALLS